MLERLKRLFGRAKEAVEDPKDAADTVKERAEGVADAARGEGSVTDKAKDAADAARGRNKDLPGSG
jgi:hypothetical protein